MCAYVSVGGVERFRGGYCRLVQCFVSFKWAEVSFQPNQTLRLGVVLVVLVVLVVVGLHLKTRAYM